MLTSSEHSNVLTDSRRATRTHHFPHANLISLNDMKDTLCKLREYRDVPSRKRQYAMPSR